MDFEPLPDVPLTAYSPFEWEEYHLECTQPDFTKPVGVGIAPRGVRYGIWPFYVEDYRSDAEPARFTQANVGAPSRIMIWHPLTRTDVPNGWWLPPGKPSLCIGFFNGLHSEYLNDWSARAGRYGRKWRREFLNKKYHITAVSYAEFSNAYAQSTVAKEIPTLELKKLAKRIDLFSKQVFLWGVRRVSDDSVVAGLAAFDSPSNYASHYSCGFYKPEVRQDHVMVGLMDYWFARSLEKDMRILHLGVFVAPQEKGSRRAKGISEFKAQFITNYHTYQPPRVRFVWGKVF